MSRPLPDAWPDEVLRRADLARLDRLLAKLDGLETRIGRRLFRTFLLTNILAVLGCFVLSLLAMKAVAP